ncbi:uncharacterized protein LOC143623640 [Bidens hawaiensis]|uniref:uncharacterized protein LOC143623640 n=1 Tax=Bidens hawaiensis TaxID=980011 RepID=UPI00404A2F6E
MSSAYGYHSVCTAATTSTQSNSLATKFTTSITQSNSLSLQLTPPTSSRRARFVSCTAARSSVNPREPKKKEDGVEEVEEDMPWIQEKALDAVEFTGSVVQALPGPRVGKSSLPWVLAVPLAYVGVSFVLSVYKTVRKLTSPKQAHRNLVGKNAELCRSIDELFEKERNGVQQQSLKGLIQKTGFSAGEILRKYIRYSLNEKPFNPQLVAALIQLRKATMLDDSQVAEILNEISRRIVKDYGPVVMDTSGYSEKGLRRKLAVQALFGKIYYLSELPEFCAKDSSLIVKEIFGAADEDAEKLRMHTVAEAGDMGSLEKMVDGSDSEDSGES